MPMEFVGRKTRQGPPESLQNGGQRAARGTGPRARPRPTVPCAMSMTESQLHLFHDETRGHSGRAAGTAPRRLELDAQSWVEHEPGWLSGHTALFGALRDGVEWHTERRAMHGAVIEVPRLTATIPDDGPSPPALARAHDALERRYGRRFESVRLAWYRDGRDSVAMHGDRIGRRIADTVVAILSLGAPRRFLLKPAAGGPSLRFDLGGGDLLVMGGACQRTWRHGIPKVKSADPRISIQFRERREYA